MATATAPRPSLFRNRDFTKLWSAATISLFGTAISLIAIPVIAVLLLGATPFEVALLGTVEFLPFLLFTLPAGVWVDRLPRKRILVVGDFGRALMLVSIPIAWYLGVLTIWQLYLVAFINGILTVFFDIADQSYLPTVIEREDLADGNAKLQASWSAAQVVGQPLGGGLVALLGAPLAVLFDAASYIASGGLILAIRRQERASSASSAATAVSIEEVGGSSSAGPSVAAEAIAAASEAPRERRPGVRQEVAEGLRFVLGHRYLRSIAATTGSSNLCTNIAFATLPIFVYVNLGLSPETFGLIGGAFGAGALIGSFTANRVASRFGVGRTIVGSVAITGPVALLVPISSHDSALILMSISGLVGGWGNVVYNVNQVSLRQTITPERMLGRMNATMRFIVWGTIPIGQIIGGLLATVFGVTTAIWVGSILGLFAFLPVFFSPVRSLRTMPEPEPEPAVAGEPGEGGPDVGEDRAAA
jgi:MFS family permease